MTQKIWTVREIVEAIKFTLEDTFNQVWVEGEVSALKFSPSRHLYFNLKDEKNNLLPCVFFRADLRTRELPTEGLVVLVRGDVSIYSGTGRYQLKVDLMESKGKGLLQIAFEKLKRRLQAEGLFEERAKKPLPFLPQKIGLITSPTGAVIHDMLTLFEKRFPNLHLILSPVRVQGKEAKEEIIQAIADFNQLKNVEVVILARGGGSIEDLQPFNEEEVARAIYKSQIPIVSAVGHEVDYTIADFTADRRAPTPSAAVEIVVPDKKKLTEKILSYRQRLLYALENKKEKEKRFFRQLVERKIMKELSSQLIEPKFQTLDYLLENLKQKVKELLADKVTLVESLKNKILFFTPQQRIKETKIKISFLPLREKMKSYLGEKKKSFFTLNEKLNLLNPRKIMAKGYSITFKLFPKRKVIKSANEVREKEEIEVRLKDGFLRSRIKEIKKIEPKT